MTDEKKREDFFDKLSEGNEIKLSFFRNLFKIVTVNNTKHRLIIKYPKHKIPL
jgi:hypothetical protein